MYTHRCFMYKISSDVYNGFEARTIDVLLDCNKLRFDLVYRQPDSSHFAAHSFHTLKLALNSVIDDKGTVFVLGDFNSPGIDCNRNSSSSSANERVISDLLVSNGFSQCVTSPTRGANLLDIVRTNDPEIISHIEVAEPFSTNDHCSVLFDLRVNAPLNHCTPSGNDAELQMKRYLWSKGDYDSMYYYLNCFKWTDLLTTNFTADDLWTAFTDQLDKAIELFVPYVLTGRIDSTQSNRRGRNYPRHIRRLQSLKRTL